MLEFLHLRAGMVVSRKSLYRERPPWSFCILELLHRKEFVTRTSALRFLRLFLVR